MMFDIFSTSCSSKPKEYNSEQEVFVTRDPGYQENGAHHEDTHTHKCSAFSAPRHLISMAGGGGLNKNFSWDASFHFGLFFFSFFTIKRPKLTWSNFSEVIFCPEIKPAETGQLAGEGQDVGQIPPPVLKIQNLSPSLHYTQCFW